MVTRLTSWLRLSRSDCAAIAVFVASISVANLAGSASWPVWVATLVAPLTLGAWQIRQGNVSQFEIRQRIQKELARRNRELSEANIVEALRQAAHIITSDKDVTRSSLMLIGQDNRLFIAYHHNMSDAPDLGLRFDKYQGCAGHSWALGKQAFADLQGVAENQLETTWKLSPEQIALTRTIKSMICTPVRDPRNRDHIVGVFSADSTEPLAQTQLDSDQTSEEALKVAEVLARLLLTGGIL